MQEIVLKGIDEKLYYDTCENGLPVYMWVNEKVNNFYATLSVKYGSIDTEFKNTDMKKMIKVPDGIAHFLEHVNFNEGEGVTAHEYFNELGSSINAFTTFHFTSYEVFASTHFGQNISHLLDYVQTPYFTKKLVEKEKGIICEEIRMGKNNPGHKLYYGMNQALFSQDKRRVLVTGEENDVKKTTCQDLQLVYDTFYHPKNMYLVITGNFNPYEAMGIVKENQNKKEFPPYKNPERKKVEEPSEVVLPYQEIEANVEIPKVKICYKMKKSLFESFDDDLINIYLSVILRNNFGTTSLLKEDLLEKELVTSIGASRDLFGDIVTIEINMETRYPEEVIPIVEEKMENLSITKEEIKRRIKANIAALINDYDDIEYVNSDISDQLVTNGKVLDNLYDIYNSLNLKDANTLISQIDLRNKSVVKLIPFKEKKDNKKIR